jgi:hypothetical protein
MKKAESNIILEADVPRSDSSQPAIQLISHQSYLMMTFLSGFLSGLINICIG